MASITRIEVANFLCDGYETGKEWIPLYRGETLRLFGQSAALQIDNGGGKTSLTEACLFLLSRNSKLKPKVEDRTAPEEKGWTHIRIEFIEKSHLENNLQNSLITVDPAEAIGTHYVIGLCWNRGKDPYFYRFQGMLEDALCFRKTPNRLELIDNEFFRDSVKNLSGSRWNNWGNIAEWQDEIRQFTNVEIIKQNVEFQLAGAGDYSAMVTKVDQHHGEPYDVAFFRQIIAPELLRQPLGNEGDEDEQKFEDTLFKSLKPAADALIDIAKLQRELNYATSAIATFQPVQEKAHTIITADADYKTELDNVIRDGAIIHEIAVKDPLPGIPRVPAHSPWLKDKKVLDVLAHLIIDKRHGILITDAGLAAITHVEAKRLNERARDKNIPSNIVDSQLIDFEGDLKKIRELNSLDPYTNNKLQVIENKGDLKESQRGKHRKYAITGYDLDSAISLVNAASHFAGVQTDGVNDLLPRAFGIAMTELDTNPYRAEKRRLSGEIKHFSKLKAEAEQEHVRWQNQYELLLTKNRETEEYQIAYETFAKRKTEFPEAYWETPLTAKTWAEQTRHDAQQVLTEHNEKKGRLGAGYTLWKRLKEQHGIISLPEALDILNKTFDSLTEQYNKENEALTEAGSKRDQLSHQVTEANSSLATLKAQSQTLSALAELLPKFREIFGDVELDNIDPARFLNEANRLLLDKTKELNEAIRQKSEIDTLLPNVAAYNDIFGDADPSLLNPVKTLIDHKEKIAGQQKTIAEHQPYLEGLNQFRNLYPSQTPDECLQKNSVAKETLNQDKANNKGRIDDLNRELTDLEKFTVADDRVYAKALEALDNGGVSFERLHETISTAARDDRRQQLLMLFSSALSAPVVTSVEDADKATKALEKAGLTVPVFLKPKLLEFAKENEINLSDPIAYTFLVGRRTRQVEILLNPSLIAEEKRRIEADIKALSLRNDEIDSELKLKSEETTLLELATSAIKRDSENTIKQAEIRLESMARELPEFERRVHAGEAIQAAKKYITFGGEESYQELSEIIIPRLTSGKQSLDERIQVLNTQVTEGATRALHAAKDYYSMGGDAELKRLTKEIEILDLQVKSLDEQLEEFESAFIKALENKVEKFTAELGQLKKTYYTDKQHLEEAINFENDGNVTFMQDEPTTRKRLDNDFKKAQSRLENIDFERANSYLQATKTQQRSIAEQLAEADNKRIQAEARKKDATNKIGTLSMQIAEIEPFIETMHDMAVVIRSQHAKIADFAEDIRNRFLEGGVHPEIIDYAEAIRLACLGDQAKTTQDVRSAIANMKVAVEDLSIETKHLFNLDKTRRKARSDFEQYRGEFCSKARNGEVKGLHSLEIEQIEKAKTLEELKALHSLKDKIEVQIKEKKANLQKISETMDSSKVATIDNLTRFARQAKMNLGILDRVMKRNPHARFIVKTEVASEERIRQIIESLLADIQDRESMAQERSSGTLNVNIEHRNKSYKDLIHSQIYRYFFIDPRVSFIHTAIRDGETRLPAPDTKLSNGQYTALAMMWLVRQAEYAQTRVAQLYGTKKERLAAMKGSQRIMFFDGLFSNLTKESYINVAFHGLKDVGDNFQLIGLIHNPYYVNNKDIFPAHLVGKRKMARNGDKERVFVAVEPWQEDNGMIVYTSAYKHNSDSQHAGA